jgi:hypothetical protein
MKRTMVLSAAILILTLSVLPFSWAADKPVRVDVLFMNHGPLQPTVKDLKALFGQYGSKVTVSWHDVETEDGQTFMGKKNIRSHIPLAIWMDDQVKFQVEGKEILFAGFPTGSGPASFQGKWKVEDLKKALDQITGKK